MGNNILQIFDLWTMKVMVQQIPTQHEITWVRQHHNKLYVIDVDLKLTVVDFSELQKQSTSENRNFAFCKRQLDLKFPCSSFFVPVRLYKDSIDPLITIEDYDIRVYNHFIIHSGKCVCFSESVVFVGDLAEMEAARQLQGVEACEEYLEAHGGVKLEVEGAKVGKVFEAQFESRTILFIENLESRN